MTTGCYLLHFEPSYKHAKHYLGYADDVEPRVHAHLHGRGARLTQVAHDAGCTMILVRVWDGATRKTERTFKNRSHVPTLCPICRGEVVQMPLLPWMPAVVPEVTEEQDVGDSAQVSDDQLTFDDHALDVRWRELADYIDDQDRRWFAAQGIDVGVEHEELINGMADEEFWRSGNW